MRAEDIREWLRRQPFKPFRIHLSDGRSFDVLHPEMVFVLRSRIELGVLENPDSTIPDRAEHIALIHVASLEELKAA